MKDELSAPQTDRCTVYTFNKFYTDIVVVCCVWALTTVRSDIENYECRQVTANILCV